MSDKEIRTDAKLKNLPADQQQEIWEMRYPVDPDQEKVTMLEVQKTLRMDYDVTCSLSTLSGFYKWKRMQQRIQDSTDRAEQAKKDWLKKNPKASADELARYGQFVFTNETIEDGNVKAFVALEKLRETRRAREFNEKKFQQAIKSKLEAGLDAMFEEIKGNKKAEAIFAQLKEVLED